MKRILLNLFILVSLSTATKLTAQVKDSPFVEHESLWAESYSQRLYNPALQYQAFSSAYSKVTYRYARRTQQAVWLSEDGKDEHSHSFSTRAYLPLNKVSTAWGSAGYNKTLTQGVRWSSSIDHDKLSPYILADSLGGDNKSERYSLNGGYVLKKGKWQFGGEMTFRAEQAYRERDPRMRSIVSDLTLRLGLARALGSKLIALSLLNETYKQKAGVTFVRPEGGVPEYLMTGIGTYQPRFSGGKSSLLYKGNNTTIALDFLPKPQSSGLYLGASWSLEHDERLSLEHNSLPLNQLYKYHWTGHIGLRHIGTWLYDISLNGKYEHKHGDEALVGDSGSGDYPILASLTLYTETHKGLEGLFTLGKGDKLPRYARLRLGYNATNMHYIYPEREASYQHIYSQVEGQIFTALSPKSTLSSGASLGYQYALPAQMNLPITQVEPSFLGYLLGRHQVLSSSLWSTSLSLAYDYRFNHTYALYAKLRAEASQVKALSQGMKYDITCSIGLRF